MDTRKFVTAVCRLNPNQRIHLTFNHGTSGISGLRRLLAMIVTNPRIRIPVGTHMNLLAVVADSSWQQVDRTVTVEGLAWTHNDTLESLAKDIESIGTDKYPSGLKYERMWPTIAEQIIFDIVTKKFVDEINGWGLQLRTSIGEYQGLPCIRLDVAPQDGGPIITFIIDAWSDRIAVDGELLDGNFTTSTAIQGLIRCLLERKLEELTTK